MPPTALERNFGRELEISAVGGATLKVSSTAWKTNEPYAALFIMLDSVPANSSLCANCMTLTLIVVGEGVLEFAQDFLGDFLLKRVFFLLSTVEPPQ